MNTYGGVEEQLHVFPTSALDGSELSQLRDGYGAGWDREPVWAWRRREKDPRPCREPNPGCPARSIFTTLTELFRLVSD